MSLIWADQRTNIHRADRKERGTFQILWKSHHQRPNLSGERNRNSHGLSRDVEYNQVGANKRSWYTSRPSDLHRAISAHFDVMENIEVYMCNLYDVPILLKTLISSLNLNLEL
jgi:hypothetical protein